MDLPRQSLSLLAAGLLTLPALVHAQETVSEQRAPSSTSKPFKTALNIGVLGQTHRLDAKDGASPVLAVNLERAVHDRFSLFAGTLFTANNFGAGLYAGGRFSFGERPLQGAFVSAQGGMTWFDSESDPDTGYDRSGSRQSLGGLVGYSHAFAERWLVSVGAGVQHAVTRTKSEPPLIPICIYFVCAREPGETVRTEKESIEPLVQLGTTFRF